MAWIKRNLFLAMAALAALILLGGAGYYLYNSWSDDNAASEELKQAQAELETLQAKKITAAMIEDAKTQKEEIKRVLDKFSKVVPPAPLLPKVDERTFKSILDKTLLDMQNAAANNGVLLLKTDYAFSFSSLTSRLNFPTNTMEIWMAQLYDIKNICEIAFNAKVNGLESIRRSPASDEEIASNGGELLACGMITNDAIIHVPYELVVRAYSRETADLINGLLLSTNCYLIKNIDIGPSSGALVQAAASSSSSSRPGRNQTAARTANPETVMASIDSNPQKPTPMVVEGLLRAVILLDIVKTKSP
jgi:hypothetical protein